MKNNRSQLGNVNIFLVIIVIIFIIITLGVIFWRNTTIANSKQQSIKNLEKRIARDFHHFKIINSEYHDTSTNMSNVGGDDSFQNYYKLTNNAGYCGLDEIRIIGKKNFITNEWDLKIYPGLRGGSTTQTYYNVYNVYDYGSTQIKISSKARDNLIRIVNSKKYCSAFGIYRLGRYHSPYEDGTIPYGVAGTSIDDDLSMHSDRNRSNYYVFTPNDERMIYYLENDEWILVKDLEK